ncbi:hypothetical protein [Nonomuraea angiospora]
MSFSQPAPANASDIKIADYVGHLILFYPRELKDGISTSNGVTDAIVADVVILTHPEGPKAERDVLIFQKVLKGSLKGKIGADPVLARLAKGVAKPGQSAPYVLNEYDQNDAAYATQYLNSVGGNPFPSFQAAPAPAPAPLPQAAPVPVAVPVAQAPVAPVAAPMAPVPQMVPQVPVAAPVAAPMPQAPGVPAAPPQWAAPAPQAAPVPVQAPVANSAEATAAMQALGMQVPPPAPAVQ